MNFLMRDYLYVYEIIINKRKISSSSELGKTNEIISKL